MILSPVRWITRTHISYYMDRGLGGELPVAAEDYQGPPHPYLPMVADELNPRLPEAEVGGRFRVVSVETRVEPTGEDSATVFVKAAVEAIDS